MEIIKWMIKVFSWPILLMNTVGGIASGLRLILLGRWADVGLRSGPIRLHSSPRFLSEVSAATYAASLPVGSITA